MSGQKEIVDLPYDMKSNVVAVAPVVEIQVGKREGTKKKLLQFCCLTWIHTFNFEKDKIFKCAAYIKIKGKYV